MLQSSKTSFSVGACRAGGGLSRFRVEGKDCVDSVRAVGACYNLGIGAHTNRARALACSPAPTTPTILSLGFSPPPPPQPPPGGLSCSLLPLTALQKMCISQRPVPAARREARVPNEQFAPRTLSGLLETRAGHGEFATLSVL